MLRHLTIATEKMTPAYNRRIYLSTSSNSQTMTSAYSRHILFIHRNHKLNKQVLETHKICLFECLRPHIYPSTPSNSQTMTSAYSRSKPCNRTKPVTSTAITTFIPVRQINDVNCNHHIKVRNNDVSCTQPHLSQYVRNNDVNLQPPYLSQYVDVSLQSPHFYPSTSAEKEE